MVRRLSLFSAALLTLAGCGASAPVSVPEAPPPVVTAPPVTPAVGSAARDAQAMAAVRGVLARCRAADCGLPVGRGVEVDTVAVVDGVAVARFSQDLGDAPVRPASAAAFEAAVAEAVRGAYPGAAVRVETRGVALTALIPNADRVPADRDADRLFAPPVASPPLVRPADEDRIPTAGLAGRHVALWPSHGWLYNADARAWGWQRARLFTTIEDLLTVGFVTRELTPMFERAGAVTLLARERDTAPEVIVDEGSRGYAETGLWGDGPTGFGLRASYGDGENPFRLGRSREAVGGARARHTATWTPDLPEAGRYAVHVSYAAGADRSEAARYTVVHAGGTTDVLVNQSIGAGTWVYLGTFEFEAGSRGRVTLVVGTDGTVSADAVRFGGGEGVIRRGAGTSGRARWMEGSRYYQQFAGAPTSVYNITDDPGNDYTDDFRSRAEWANWLRGAPFGPSDAPDLPGLGIPVDAVLAWHTDAGIDRDGTIGTLAIYNVPGMDESGAFADGTSRLANRDLADGVQTTLVDDIRRLYAPSWSRRQLWDRSYSESTRPAVPSLLLELLSHQNFRDMRFALDPRFQFDAARAVYKGYGRFLAAQRGDRFVPQPLRPTHVYALLEGDRVALGWRPQPDPLEPDALPTAYVVYTRDGAIGWDEGTRVEGTSVRLPAPPPGIVRSYRVAGVNEGGEGRPSEALAVGMGEPGASQVLIVDGFDRVAPPDAVDEPGRAGFVDPVGVPEGAGVITVGAQRVFDPSAEYVSDPEPGWGASGSELEGTLIMGNDRDHAAVHGRALLAAERSFSSASDEAVADGVVSLGDYQAVDLILGLERRTAWPDPADTRPPAFEALPEPLRDRLGVYLDGGGALIVSGAHWASDAASDFASAVWVRTHLGVRADGRADGVLAVALGGSAVPFGTAYGPRRYAVRWPDVLAPSDVRAEIVGRFGSGEVAAIAHGRTVSLSVPLESVFDVEARAGLMEEALRQVLGE